MHASTSLKSQLLGSVLSVCLTFGFAAGATAQTATVVLPTPKEVIGAETPGDNKEGLTIVRFTVKADGSTDNIEVLGGFTNAYMARSYEATVKTWTFNPGTRNGEAVDFHNQKFIISARSSQDLTISTVAQDALNDITAELPDGNLIKALRFLDTLQTQAAITVFDYAYAYDVQADVHMADDNLYAALAASKMATMSRVSSAGETEFFLPSTFLDSALRKRFVLAATLKQYGEALRAYEILAANVDIPSDDNINNQADAVRALVESPDPLISLAGLTEYEWTYEPVHRIFAVADVKGSLSKINVRCDHRLLLELEFKEGVDWTLPDSFGKCELEFVGSKTAQFTLYEFAE